ncbi:hypothetical protein Hanom_Chr00s008371g01740391 [Helianthus anomalus]
MHHFNKWFEDKDYPSEVERMCTPSNHRLRGWFEVCAALLIRSPADLQHNNRWQPT